MCRLDSRVQLSAEEALAAEESLSIYCKPVELYNILRRHVIRNDTNDNFIVTVCNGKSDCVSSLHLSCKTCF
ncbi:polycomb group protein EMBRYONIC FLOWER 2-like [Quillaja saponaria]|uniref:Polycomb group protein EMBRYONIC FLOWER 2-like n=1 Tax=Quillaja saponaria TaxID=32244 RepID=A0AAD7M641_QUISA|nr:polycomb group protein EMBRYONIC FLOWER 2-like [Quillaja saponaria]